MAIDAGSIKTGTLSADRIAAGSISASKLDAVGIKSSIINTDYINGLSCTFTKGKIGGFSIGSDNMTIGNVGAVGAIPLQIRSASTGSGYWYTGAYSAVYALRGIRAAMQGISSSGRWRHPATVSRPDS